MKVIAKICPKNNDIEKEKLSYKKKSGISDEIVDRIIDQLN